MNPLILTLLYISSYVFILALVVVLGFQLFSGIINTRGLLTDKVTGKFSPGRLQLIILTLVGSLLYLYQVFQAGKFIALSDELLMAIGGSNVVYLSGKSYSVFRRITKAHKYLDLLKR